MCNIDKNMLLCNQFFPSHGGEQAASVPKVVGSICKTIVMPDHHFSIPMDSFPLLRMCMKPLSLSLSLSLSHSNCVKNIKIKEPRLDPLFCVERLVVEDPHSRLLGKPRNNAFPPWTREERANYLTQDATNECADKPRVGYLPPSVCLLFFLRLCLILCKVR
jgi:hypothetical protein